MSIYTDPRIRLIMEDIGKVMEKQVGHPLPMLSDTLRMLTGPDVIEILRDLIDIVEEVEFEYARQEAREARIAKMFDEAIEVHIDARQGSHVLHGL